MPEWFGILISGTVGVIVGAIIPVFTRFLEFRLNRKQEIWKHSLEVLWKVEEKTSYLAEILSSSQDISGQIDELDGNCREIQILTGTVRRHRNLANALRDFHNTAARIIEDRKRFESRGERDETMRELQDRYEAVLTEIDKVLEW